MEKSKRKKQKKEKNIHLDVFQGFCVSKFHPPPLSDGGERVARGSGQGGRAVGMTVEW